MKLRNVVLTLLGLYFVLFFVSAFSLTYSTEDSFITNKIRTTISEDKSLSNFHLDIKTNRGIVKLKGTVNSDTDASKIIELAESTNGVIDVDTSELRVKKSSTPLSDTFITAKIKGLFIQNKLFGNDVSAMTIKVETNNKVVYLSGTADNQDQIDSAIKIAKSVKDVKDVKSSISVK